MLQAKIYHVVNKNIASSKVTDRRKQKRGCLPGASPSLGSCYSLLDYPKLYPKLENFNHTKLKTKLVSSVSIRK